MVRAVILCGPMKTGTSALAKGLTEMSRLGSLPDGVMYPIDPCWSKGKAREIVKHHELRALTSTVSDRRTSKHEARQQLRAVGDKSRDNASGSSEPTVIFIWESLAGRIAKNSSTLDQLNKELGSVFQQVDYVLGIRRQDQALRSMYAHLIRGDRGLREANFEEFVEARSYWSSYDYWRIYERFREQGLSGSFHPLLFSESDIGTTALLQRFFGTIGFRAVDLSTSGLDGRLIHPSLPAQSLNTILRIRRLTDRFPEQSRAQGWAEAFWKNLRKRQLVKMDRIARKDPIIAAGRRMQLSPTLSGAIMDAFRDSNERFAESFSKDSPESWLPMRREKQ